MTNIYLEILRVTAPVAQVKSSSGPQKYSSRNTTLGSPKFSVSRSFAKQFGYSDSWKSIKSPDLVQNIWTGKRLSLSDIFIYFWSVFILRWFFHSSDGVGDRIRTKVHLDIVGKFCTAELTPKNVLYRCFIPPSPGLVSGLHIGLLCLTISHAVLICHLIRYWKSPGN